MNRFEFIGRIASLPEMKVTEQSKRTSFRLAVNREFKNKNGEKEADFFTIVSWGKLAEISSKYLIKGLLVFVEGHIDNQRWKDKNGETQYMNSFIATKITFLGSKDRAPEEQNLEINEDIYLDDYFQMGIEDSY